MNIADRPRSYSRSIVLLPGIASKCASLAPVDNWLAENADLFLVPAPDREGSLAATARGRAESHNRSTAIHRLYGICDPVRSPDGSSPRPSANPGGLHKPDPGYRMLPDSWGRWQSPGLLPQSIFESAARKNKSAPVGNATLRSRDSIGWPS